MYFVGWFFFLVAICIVLHLRQGKKESVPVTPEYKQFSRGYVAIYLLAMGISFLFFDFDFEF